MEWKGQWEVAISQELLSLSQSLPLTTLVELDLESARETYWITQLRRGLLSSRREGGGERGGGEWGIEVVGQRGLCFFLTLTIIIHPVTHSLTLMLLPT